MTTYSKLSSTKKEMLSQRSKAYNATNYKSYGIRLHYEYDRDLVEFLNSKPSISAYFKELVRADMERTRACESSKAGSTIVVSTNPYEVGERHVHLSEDVLCSLPEEWDAEQNGLLEDFDAEKNVNVPVYWRCSKCGYIWRASVHQKYISRSRSCPACAGRRVVAGLNDLATQRPDIAAEWYYPANGTLKPSDVLPDSYRKVHWKCKKCGYVWAASVHSRVYAHTGCPFCKSAKE